MILDLFAGPGGWDEGLRLLGNTDPVVGIEWDAAACATRRAAGHLTIRADVAQYPTQPFNGISGLIASPPCPTFSNAGKGEGRNELPELLGFVRGFSKRGWFDPWDWHQWSDPRTPLVLEPLRWFAIRPSWLALEQVPAVVPLWDAYVSVFRDAGYSAWAGVLNAADYGVPQTRERAFCIASAVGVAHPPEPTHTEGGASTMFGELAPWVSMADALGWGMTERPYVTVAHGHQDAALVGGSGARATLERERERVVGYRRSRGLGMLERHGDRPDTPIDKPAPTLTSKARSDVWVVDRRTNSRAAGGGTEPTVPVPMDRPAPTLTAKAGGQWMFREAQAHGARRTPDQPAPTITASADNGNFAWVYERPATTLCGDSRCFAPGGHIANDGRDNSKMVGRSAEAIKLSVAEALTLQSFPADYPVQGTKSKQFEQIGNAVPPRLAAHVLASLIAHLAVAA